MCTDEFAFWFESKYDVDFNEFTMTRFYIVNMVIDANLTNYGLGTVTHYLEVLGNEGQTNMHNDILRIYMETTIIGSIVFTYCFFKITTKNIYSYILMLFMFVELYVAHFLGPATILFWIFVYFDIFYFNSELILKSPKKKSSFGSYKS
jgi:O-antigen ligase